MRAREGTPPERAARLRSRSEARDNERQRGGAPSRARAHARMGQAEEKIKHQGKQSFFFRPGQRERLVLLKATPPAILPDLRCLLSTCRT